MSLQDVEHLQKKKGLTEGKQKESQRVREDVIPGDRMQNQENHMTTSQTQTELSYSEEDVAQRVLQNM